MNVDYHAIQIINAVAAAITLIIGFSFFVVAEDEMLGFVRAIVNRLQEELYLWWD